MTDYSDLIARLEKADGPDTRLDEDIAQAVSVEMEFGQLADAPAGVGCMMYRLREGGGMSSALRVTASLDAAIALTNKMLPGWTMAVDATVPGAGIDYSLYSPTDPDGTQPTAKGGVRADSIGDVSAHARALLIATLSALQSLEQKEAA